MRDSIYGFEAVLNAKSVHLITKTPPLWAVMDDFKGQAKNHCCAASLLNALRLAEDFKAPLSKEQERFARIHLFLKNGPVFHIAPGANRYLKLVHSPWRVVRIKKSAIIPALEKNQPVFLMVSGDLFHWHWVVVCGFYDDKDGARHLLIEDNWHRQGYESIPVSKLTLSYFRAAACLAESQDAK